MVDSESVTVYYLINTLMEIKVIIGGEVLNIQFNEREAIYVQIINYYKSKIAANHMREGDRLPSVRELSAEVGVNPNTVQRAFAELEREGLAYTLRGKGKFIKCDESQMKSLKLEMSEEIVAKFVSDMKQLGFEKGEIIDIIAKQ